MYDAIILAAGVGKRSGLEENKILYMLEGKPLFMHSVDAFLKESINVILVINKQDEEEILKYYKGTYTYGGKTRSDSVYNGLKEAKAQYVLIHDAARPFVKDDVISKIKEELKKYDAVMCYRKVVDTIYEDFKVLNRDKLMIALTPQAFLREKYLACFKGDVSNFTDDISLYKNLYSDEVGLVETENKKVTTKEDIKALSPNFKIGYSYDIHKTDKTRPLILGGIKIENGFGLLGHSDADVLLHAIGESLIGALGLGDLGTHFPDTDMRYKDLDSKKILSFVKNLLTKEGYAIENIDASIFAERPKLASYLPKMKEVIADILKINKSQVNIKAGTNEGMDSIGESQAIAASCVSMIRRIK
ncbi:MAG: 2-C-methyl-D-erythritol 2,4-cyclodiphosphate synthase [Acholeplasmatales bacterium]